MYEQHITLTKQRVPTALTAIVGWGGLQSTQFAAFKPQAVAWDCSPMHKPPGQPEGLSDDFTLTMTVRACMLVHATANLHYSQL